MAANQVSTLSYPIPTPLKQRPRSLLLLISVFSRRQDGFWILIINTITNKGLLSLPATGLSLHANVSYVYVLSSNVEEGGRWPSWGLDFQRAVCIYTLTPGTMTLNSLNNTICPKRLVDADKPGNPWLLFMLIVLNVLLSLLLREMQTGPKCRQV